ncbi:MAG TPA: pectin acetylesterase-family hydrolase [Kofleriaceae bacterium]|jgi:hypothetical protein|nr:pectin acetylesterase-family hydrolase [Kofleriaceae bacterium]
MKLAGAVFFTSIVVSGAACGGGDGQSGGPPDTGTPPKTWTYVPIAGNVCMNNTPTGIAVNLGTSGDLVLYMEGGGACFNDKTCGSAAHQDGWPDKDGFDFDIGPYNIGVFDRNEPTNPLRDATFVFIPYCTGDVHAGSNPTGMGGRVMVGYQNVGRILDYLVPISSKVSRVIVAGSSAGGFGALINYDRAANRFAPTPTDLIDDSGPPLSDTYMTPCLQQQFRDAWNLNAAIPEGCTACREPNGGGLTNALGWLADAHPDARLALISSTRDGTIRSFFGFGYPDCNSNGNPMEEAPFAAGIAELRDVTLANHPNFRVYSKDSDLHVWLVRTLDEVSPDSNGSGEHLSVWLKDMLSGATPWDSVKP